MMISRLKIYRVGVFLFVPECKWQMGLNNSVLLVWCGCWSNYLHSQIMTSPWNCLRPLRCHESLFACVESTVKINSFIWAHVIRGTVCVHPCANCLLHAPVPMQAKGLGLSSSVLNMCKHWDWEEDDHKGWMGKDWYSSFCMLPLMVIWIMNGL